jgi:uncharacterized coiled-coil DUF342 family protein
MTLTEELKSSKEREKQLKELVSAFNSNRANLENQLENYKVESERLNEEFTEFTSTRKELRELKEKNIELLKQAISKAYSHI